MFSHIFGSADPGSHEEPDKLRLGGERRVLTIFFSDLPGSHPVGKAQPGRGGEPPERYLTAMTEIILASGGVIDKYEGDAIMAFWGAPLPRKITPPRLSGGAGQSAPGGRTAGGVRPDRASPIRARIGINTGEMIIGNMGSSQRFDFTVIGDSVNLASRLEGAGKEYGSHPHQRGDLPPGGRPRGSPRTRSAACQGQGPAGADL